MFRLYFFTNFLMDALCICIADRDKKNSKQLINRAKVKSEPDLFSLSIGPINLISWAGVKLNWFDFLGADATGHKIRRSPRSISLIANINIKSFVHFHLSSLRPAIISHDEWIRLQIQSVGVSGTHWVRTFVIDSNWYLGYLGTLYWWGQDIGNMGQRPWQLSQ